jgi:hypothetical protein
MAVAFLGVKILPAAASGTPPVGVDDIYTMISGGTLTCDVLANDTDAEGDALAAWLLTGRAFPAPGCVSPQGLGFEYVPTPGWSGIASFTYQAFDGTSYSNHTTVYVAVSPVSVLPSNSAPVASADATEVVEDEPKRLTVLENDSDADGDALSAIKVTDPSHGSLVATSSGFIYTPALNYNGTDSFIYLASDGNSFSAPVSVTITVTPVNDAPAAMADTVTVSEDTSKSIGVLSNDVPHVLAVEYTGLKNSASSSARINMDAFGVITDAPIYDPTIESSDPRVTRAGSWITFVTGSTGILYGSSGCAATVAFNGTGIDLIALTGPTYGIARVTLDSVETTMVDLYSPTYEFKRAVYSRRGLPVVDVDGEPLSAVKVTDPSHGSLVATSSGFIYTPAANYSGTDSFTYLASDGASSSAPVTVTINVAPVNDPPPAAVPDSFNLSEDTPRRIGVLSNDVSHVLAVEYTGLKNSASSSARINMDAFGVITDDATYDSAFESSDPRVPRAGSWTPAPVAGASDGSILYGSSGCSATVDFKGTGIDLIALTGPTYGIARVTLDSVETTMVDLYSPTYQYKRVVYSRRGLAVQDADGQTLTAVKVTDPSHGSIVATSGGFFYTPAPEYSGTDSFTYCASDGITTSVPASVTINVTALNDLPTFTKGSDITVVRDSGAYFSTWATSVSPGAPNESSQNLKFVVTTSRPSLFREGPVVTTGGVLGFNVAPGVWGSADCTVTLTDDSTAGGPALSRTETFKITVLRNSWVNITSPSLILPRYGSAYSVSGSLLTFVNGQASGVALARVRLQTAPAASGPYTNTSVVATTSATGYFTLLHVPRSKTFYRVVYEGDAVNAGSISAYRYAIPRVSVSKPVAPAVMYTARAASVYSVIVPQHSAGTYPVRIYRYRYTAGYWKSYGYVLARAYSIPGGSKAIAAIRLPYRGSWRLKAYAPPDAAHAGTWAVGYDSVTVR